MSVPSNIHDIKMFTVYPPLSWSEKMLRAIGVSVEKGMPHSLLITACGVKGNGKITPVRMALSLNHGTVVEVYIPPHEAPADWRLESIEPTLSAKRISELLNLLERQDIIRLELRHKAQAAWRVTHPAG